MSSSSSHFIDSPASSFGSFSSFDFSTSLPSTNPSLPFLPCPIFASQDNNNPNHPIALKQKVRHLCSNLCFFNAYAPIRTWCLLNQAVKDAGFLSSLLSGWTVELVRRPDNVPPSLNSWRVCIRAPDGSEFFSVKSACNALFITTDGSSSANSTSATLVIAEIMQSQSWCDIVGNKRLLTLISNDNATSSSSPPAKKHSALQASPFFSCGSTPPSTQTESSSSPFFTSSQSQETSTSIPSTATSSSSSREVSLSSVITSSSPSLYAKTLWEGKLFHVNALLSSPYGFLEELCSTPWTLLLCCIFLNRTSRKQVDPVFHRFLQTYPTPESVANAQVDEVAIIIKPLGINLRRAANVVAMSQQYVKSVTTNKTNPTTFDQETVKSFTSVGTYGWDAYCIFVLNKFDTHVVESGDYALRIYSEYRRGVVKAVEKDTAKRVMCRGESSESDVKENGNNEKEEDTLLDR